MKHSAPVQVAQERPTKPRAGVRATNAQAHLNGASDQASPEHEEIIRQAAYGFYEARGRSAGHALEDWLKAEKNLSQTANGEKTSSRPRSRGAL
ncbi:MAG: DUF2934 domain-containing protein [Betaproteobacteria bacterium]|nr:DUF2934 domain-containing protein [Betaproteobacteria bacterium]